MISIADAIESLDKCYIMNKLIAIFVAVFVSLNIKAETSSIQNIQPKGCFNIACQVGIPPISQGWEANMPLVSMDVSWIISSGFLNTRNIGRNGAVDLGFYFSTCQYERDHPSVLYSYDDPFSYDSYPDDNYPNNTGNKDPDGLWQNCLLLRSAFHYMFVQRLDTYVGLFLGTNTVDPYKNSDWDHETNACMGTIVGAKYFFTGCFGVKTEIGYDFRRGEYPILSLGANLKF